MFRTPLIEPFLLANPHLLALLEDARRPLNQALDLRLVREAAYLGQHGVHHSLPDHVFEHRWQALQQEQHLRAGHLIAPTLFSLAQQFLYLEQQRACVHLSRFADWQNLLARISTLPLQAALFALHDWGRMEPSQPQLLRQRIAQAMGATCLVYPHDAAVEDYLAREGLHETHLHLNGTTLAELCWQRALLDPAQAVRDFDQVYQSSSHVQELCHLIDPALNPQRFARRLQLARMIRSLLLQKADGKSVPLTAHWLREPRHSGADSVFSARTLLDAHQLEVCWLTRILQQLKQKPQMQTDRLLHLYLLLQHQHLQLMVQRDDFFGFDQFQKFTFSGLRWRAEEEYYARFCQLHGHLQQDSQVVYLEGRCAPKDSAAENLELLSTILRGYWHYLYGETYSAYPADRPGLSRLLSELGAYDFHTGQRKLRLALVFHFIKKKWDTNKEPSRHAALRAGLRQQLDQLCACLRHEPGLLPYVRGVDAAANELHAGAEVFAPVFRLARSAGLSRQTFHAGEDFVHLAGGVRQIHDALHLPGLRAGDRIGHATAIGILPARWLAGMPHSMHVKQGEWLLDLICAWHLLRYFSPAHGDVHQIAHSAAQKAAHAAVQLAASLFPHACNIEDLQMMSALRGLWPSYVFAACDDPNWRWQEVSLHDGWREEAKLVAQARAERGRHLQMLAYWLRDPALLEQSERMLRIPSDFFSAQELLCLQQALQQQVLAANVVLETLPTSNVRISQYQHLQEHHSLRWMGAPGHKVEGDANLLVSLGSDDPGIFATDLRAEFYHLYAQLRQLDGMHDQQALQMLGVINERGRVYRFHPR